MIPSYRRLPIYLVTVNDGWFYFFFFFFFGLLKFYTNFASCAQYVLSSTASQQLCKLCRGFFCQISLPLVIHQMPNVSHFQLISNATSDFALDKSWFQIHLYTVYIYHYCCVSFIPPPNNQQVFTIDHHFTLHHPSINQTEFDDRRLSQSTF